MANIILPATYVTVRDEGLISVGGVSTGNVGVVGTAADSTTDTVHLVTSLTDARDLLGSTSGQASSGNLFKTLEILFANGAGTVYVVVVADESPESYRAGLELLANETVNIVLLAGQDATTELAAFSNARTPRRLTPRIRAKGEPQHARRLPVP